MDEEDLNMTLMCSFLDSWDNLLIIVKSIAKKLALDEVVIYLLLEEMMQKAYESIKEALVIQGRLKEKGKKREKGISKSYGRSKSHGNSKVRC